MSKDPKTEWEEDAEFSILDGNPYYIDGPTYKIRHDISDIVLYGEIPKMKSQPEQFICAVEVGKFIKRNGFSGCEENIAKLLQYLDVHQRVVCMQQWTTAQLNYAVEHEAFAFLRREMSV